MPKQVADRCDCEDPKSCCAEQERLKLALNELPTIKMVFSKARKDIHDAQSYHDYGTFTEEALRKIIS